MPWWTALLARHGIQQSGHSLSHLQLVDFIGSACRLLRDSFAHLNGNRHGCTKGPPLDIVGFQSNRNRHDPNDASAFASRGPNRTSATYARCASGLIDFTTVAWDEMKMGCI